MHADPADIKKILEEASVHLVGDDERSIQFANSLGNCHTKGVFSLWISNCLRAFIILNPSEAKEWSYHDETDVHKYNSHFLIHNHRYPLTSIPLSDPETTTQWNIIYKEVMEDSRESKCYKKYLYHSPLFEADKTPKYIHKETVNLKSISSTKNEAWFMEKEEIHRIVWQGPIIALLFEHKPYAHYTNKKPTLSYLINSATEFPCHQPSLYRPMTPEEFNTCRSLVLHAINNKCNTTT